MTDDKSHVTMEARICLACCQEYETGNILMDKRLLPRFNRITVTGWGMCEEHAKQIAEGNVCLVEIDPSKSPQTGDGLVKPEDAYRTGLTMMIKRDVFNESMNADVAKIADNQPVVFVEVGMFEKMLGKEGLAHFRAKSPARPPSPNAPGSNSLN